MSQSFIRYLTGQKRAALVLRTTITDSTNYTYQVKRCAVIWFMWITGVYIESPNVHRFRQLRIKCFFQISSIIDMKTYYLRVKSHVCSRLWQSNSKQVFIFHETNSKRENAASEFRAFCVLCRSVHFEDGGQVATEQHAF